MGVLKLIVTAVLAIHGRIITTEHWSDKMAASRFFPVATHGTTAKIKQKMEILNDSWQIFPQAIHNM